jgi:DNA-binding transcriptional MerR regulator
MIKDQFSIKDLENLTGIKIPTLRIWEKRYDILSPKRTETGIRTYSSEELAYLLNIVFLNQHGFKISKIAHLSEKEVNYQVRNIDKAHLKNPYEVEAFIMAMLEFNQGKFQEIYAELLKDNTFDQIYEEYFTPLLMRIGRLWQTSTIDVIHEHFISSLILQKIVARIDQFPSFSQGKTYVLFLPQNEIHEIGLRYMQYKLLSQKKNTLYLGNHVDLDQLHRFKNRTDVVLISNLTINPHKKSLKDYLSLLNDFQMETSLPIHLYGLQFYTHDELISPNSNIQISKSAEEVLNRL